MKQIAVSSNKSSIIHPTADSASLISMRDKTSLLLSSKLRFSLPDQKNPCSLPKSFHSSEAKMPTYLAINIGTQNTYLAVKEEGSHNPPRFIKKIKTEVMVPLKPDPHAKTPGTKIPGFIRLIGREFDDPIVQKEMKMVPYKIVTALNGSTTMIQTPAGFKYSPKVLLETFFLKVKKIAESQLGYALSSFVLTFPSKVRFDQMNEVTDMLHTVARGSRKFECLLINEFTAAVNAYGLVNKEGLYAIVDFGARTLDVVLFQVILKGRDSDARIMNLAQMQFSHGPDGREFQIIGKEIRSDMFFGGDDFDYVVAEFLVNEFKNTEGIDLTTNTSVIESLRDVAEKAKVELSSSSETEINVPILTIDASGATKGLKVTLTRPKFQTLAAQLIERIRNYCETHLKEVGVKAKNVDKVILVGGMANVPMVKRVVSEVFGKTPVRGVNPEEAVGLGAAAAVEAGCMGLHPNTTPEVIRVTVHLS